MNNAFLRGVVDIYVQTTSCKIESLKIGNRVFFPAQIHSFGPDGIYNSISIVLSQGTLEWVSLKTHVWVSLAVCCWTLLPCSPASLSGARDRRWLPLGATDRRWRPQ